MVPFPVESTSIAVTSICDVLSTAHIAGAVVGADRQVKFLTPDASTLLGFRRSELPPLKNLEAKLGFKLPDIRQSYSARIKVAHQPVDFSIVPLAGGAAASVLILRTVDAAPSPSFENYVSETIMQPLRSLREALLAAAKNRGRDPLLEDSASTVDQILSSLELTPSLEDTKGAIPAAVPVLEILGTVAEKFQPMVNLKNVSVQVDGTTAATFQAHEPLEESLTILMENSLHYVPAGGQIVLGARQLEHKGKALLLFFVMDNGPIVPEELRDQIFSPDFEWQPSAGPRTGRGLAKCRHFALAHGGQVWVESKTGKACTFFLRVRPDNAR
ncbi:MAG: HAMP domain-containing sensor histidine kinase [Thermoanaerobaculia bacterium]